MNESRSRGLAAAQIAIKNMLLEANACCAPYGKRQGRKLAWWQGYEQGLIAAECMLALADFPEHPENAKQIKELLASARIIKS